MTSTQHSPSKTAQLTSLVYGWGNMTHGQLGFGGIEDEQIVSARELQSMSGKHVKDIALGVEHSLFVMDDGLVYSCGNNDVGQLGHEKARRRPELINALETQVISVVGGGMLHSVAVNSAGQLFSWGDNQQGQLGRTCADSYSITPKLVRELSSYNIIQVSCGYHHTLALTDVGQLFSWGRNNEGQLGVNLPDGHASSAGGQSQSQPHSYVYCVTKLRGLALCQIAAGSRHSAALTVSGALFTWGNNRYGQLGVGDEKDRSSPELCQKLRSFRVKYVTCGEEHTAVLTKEGGVYTFGAGMYGQLGHGTAQSESSPRRVQELMGSDVTMIACGRRHTLAYVESSNKLFTFGLGGNGQLGLGTRNNRLLPTPLPQLPSAKSAAADNVMIVSIYAGGDQCLVLAAQSPSGNNNRSGKRVARDFRSQRIGGSQILTLSSDTIRQYGQACEVEKPSVEFQGRIEKVFQSMSCINASFLAENDQHFFCSKTNHGVSVTEAERVFQLIGELKNDYIKQVILGAIEKSLIPSLVDPPVADIEALRLFITLPCLHYFNDPAYYDTIICPFGFAIMQQTSGEFSKVFDSWWLQLGADYLLKLIKIFKSVLLHILNESPTQIDYTMRKRRCGLYICLEMLRRLHSTNESTASGNGRLVPHESFYVPELKDKVELRVDYIFWLQSMGAQIPVDVNPDISKLPASPNGKTMLYCNYPFLFDGQAKTLILQVDGMIQMQKAVDEVSRRNLVSLFLPIDPVHPFLILHVHRNSIVQDTINQIAKQPAVDFKKPMKVIFRDEEALDAGGVKKEFFMLLLKEILDPKYGMFEYFPESKLLWFSQESFETTEMYGLIGVLCGLAIYNFIIIDISLPLALYRKLLKRNVTLDDLKQLQPSVGRSMQQLLDYTGNDFTEVFSISFEITREVYGAVKVIELIPNGSQISVTQDNKQEFVDAYVDYVFNNSVKEQYEAFSRGFLKVCGGPVLNLFEPQELQEMVVGNENYDWQELEKNTEYKEEYSANHPTIRMFWSVFHEDLAIVDKKKFLLFLTGSDRIPILGMKAVKLIIQPVKVDERFLPVAHTCFNLLDLPMYSERETMRRKLLAAIEHTHGFGLV